MPGELDQSPLADGWHALPSGGKVLVEAGVPVLASDQGNPYLDERTILSESAALGNARLQFLSDRSMRWSKPSVLNLLKSGSTPHESVAKLLRAPCEHCGQEAGSVWWPVPGEAPGWVCIECRGRLSDGEPWDE